ncbi:MAG: cysteine desulfurase [Candidatus Marinimicrobia bacterium]|nr:cysteine desulfurase [Candidatus Neomarinimicrobiota bacterium]
MDIRKDFPLLNQLIDGKPLVYLDSAATTQKPQAVLDTIADYYSAYNANIHRGIYHIAEKATSEFEAVRHRVASFINANQRVEIIFTKGTTESINLVAYSWGRKFLKPGDEILITEMEHHSNNVPWQLVAQITGATLKYIPVNDDGELETPLDHINEKTKLVAVIHQSNVLGTVNPVEAIISRAHEVGAKVLVDGAQSTPHLPIDVQDMDCDFFTFSGHKMMGPTGVGVLYGKQEILNEMDPFLGGGEMIKNVSMDAVSFNELPWKFEAGTPNIAQVIGLGSAIDYINKIGLNVIHEHGELLTEYALEKLSEIDDITIYGHAQDRGPVVSFNIDGVHPHDLAQLLDQLHICIRVGHHCAQPLLTKFGITSSARASFYVYNTTDEIDFLIQGIEKAVSILK